MSSQRSLSPLSARVRRFIDSPDPGAFNALALELFDFQFTHNVPYRRICQARKLSPREVEHWSRIPTVPTSAFKDFEMSCLPQTERTTVFHSSGTTEQRPSRHFHNAESLGVYEHSLLSWFERSVDASPLPQSKIEIQNSKMNRRNLAILTPPPRRAPHSSLVHMFDTIRRSWGLPESAFLANTAEDGSWQLPLPETVDLLSSVANSGAPFTIFGTAFSFVHLLDYLEHAGLNLTLPPGSRVLETGGYKGRSRVVPKPELHRLICVRLGLKPGNIICEYGMSELGSQAYEQPGNDAESARTFLFPPWARAQVISPENGQEVAEGVPGLIRALDLTNVASVASVQTEDIGIKRGHGFELLGRVEASERRGCSLMPAAHSL